MTISLHAHDLQWVRGPEDDPQDQCAHGRVEFWIDGVVFVEPSDGLWTVSAAALTLLRSVERSHTREQGVAEAQLFPCCGFSALPCGGEYPVAWTGCPSGIDVWVIHRDGRIAIESEGGLVATVPPSEWAAAVAGFADEVRDFYAASARKAAPEATLERAGWAAFWREWDVRRRALGTRR